MDLNQRASGIMLHVTSLQRSHGVADLGTAACHFVDWLEVARQRMRKCCR